MVLSVIQAGGQGSRLDVLTRERAKPALSFAGSFQLIDIALTNCAHSGISDVWLSVQYQAGSLHHHLSAGRPWDLDRTRGGLRWLMPEEGGGSTAQDGFSNGKGDDLHRFADAVSARDDRGDSDSGGREGVVTVGRGSRVTTIDDKPEHPSGTTIAADRRRGSRLGRRPRRHRAGWRQARARNHRLTGVPPVTYWSIQGRGPAEGWVAATVSA